MPTSTQWLLDAVGDTGRNSISRLIFNLGRYSANISYERTERRVLEGLLTKHCSGRAADASVIPKNKLTYG